MDMNVSSRCEYACRAVVELAHHENATQPLTVEAIAMRRRVPEKFLIHILLQLKRVGIVRSVRGAKGGYLLGRAPEDITLLDIVEAVEGRVLDALRGNEGALSGERAASSEMAGAWEKVARGVENVLRETTVRGLLDESLRGSMYYI